MGAFLGRSLLLRGLTAGSEVAAELVVDEGCVDANVALLFCASSSLIATLGESSFLCHGAVGGQVCCWSAEMLVSGDPLFFGGGGMVGSKV
jgi:hypothetical protein